MWLKKTLCYWQSRQYCPKLYKSLLAAYLRILSQKVMCVRKWDRKWKTNYCVMGHRCSIEFALERCIAVDWWSRLAQECSCWVCWWHRLSVITLTQCVSSQSTCQEMWQRVLLTIYLLVVLTCCLICGQVEICPVLCEKPAVADETCKCVKWSVRFVPRMCCYQSYG